MRPNGVVVPSPGLDDDLGFTQRIEDLSVEQFVPQTSIEAFNVAVLPRAAWFDVSGVGTHSSDPVLHRLGHELRAIVGADMTRHARQDEEVRQDVDHVDGFELAIDLRLPIPFPLPHLGPLFGDFSFEISLSRFLEPLSVSRIGGKGLNFLHTWRLRHNGHFWQVSLLQSGR
jgi:hypothetical protein